MELKLWSPWLDLERQLRSTFDRLPGLLGESVEFEFRPRVDVSKEEDSLVVTIEVPGIDPEEDLDISVEGDVLVIQGEKTAARETSEENRYLQERHYGRFERRLPLPDGVDPDRIEASYAKGVVTLTVPLPSGTEGGRRRVQVTRREE